MILDIEKLIAKSHEMSAKKWRNRNLDDLGDLLPEDQDKSVLFKRNWLAIGQAFCLVASSGVGKSSMAAQMALHWALGDEFLASPTRPLKIAMIQAEDSDRDLQEQRDGMIRGMADEGYAHERIHEAIKRVFYPTDFIGVQGDSFIQMLTEFQGDMKFDMVFVNPLQRFFGADVSSQEDASHFCAGLDKIMKHKDYGCTMGIIMHTPKFHSGIKDGRQSVDDYAEYAMAGSQEWTAWIRAVINFQKHGASEDYFDLKASKRGKRLGWKNAQGEPITKRVFKHSDGFIYWREVTDEEELAAIPESKPKKREKDPFVAAACASQIALELCERFGLSSPSPHCRNALVKDAYKLIKPLGRTLENAEATIYEIWKCASTYGLKIVKHPLYSGETIARED